MSIKFPTQYDDDNSSFPILGNKDPILPENFNIIREAILNIEHALGLKPGGDDGYTVRAKLDLLQNLQPQISSKIAYACSPDVEVGNLVCNTQTIDGILFVKCNPYDPATMPAVGIVINKPTSESCIIVNFGNMDIQGITPGANYFVGLDGNLSTDAPVAVNTPVYIQSIGFGLSNNKFFIQAGEVIKALP